MSTFIASRLTEDNTVFPDKLEIGPSNVVFYKGTLIGYRSTVIPKDNIASVYIVSRVFFADVVIETIGGKQIRASGFKKGDARTIVSLLT